MNTAILDYTREKVFHVVHDVSSYSSFLEWCTKSYMSQLNEDTIIGTMELTYVGINIKLTTRNTFKSPEYINMNLIEGPFKHFVGLWEFRKLGDDKCKVCLKIEYSFVNIILDKLLQPLVKYATNDILNSFKRQASSLYDYS